MKSDKGEGCLFVRVMILVVLLCFPLAGILFVLSPKLFLGH